MKKKLFSFVLSLCLAISCVFMLTACSEPAHTHTYEDGKCTECGYIEETDLNLEYTDDTYTEWKVVKDANRTFANLKYIRIPAEWGGKPVVEIDKEAFWQYQAIEIIIPDSVTKIGDSAFIRCVNLTTVVLPEDVTSIGQNVFFGCTSLASINIPANVEKIDYYAFAETAITEIAIPSGVTEIAGSTFSDCTQLNSVVLPAGLTRIKDFAFKGCTSLTTVYFAGTAEDWLEVTIGSGNYCLTGDAIYYYSASQPTDSGNYWHYEQDGKTPTKW